MNIHYVSQSHVQGVPRYKRVLRRIVVDVFPTIFLLFVLIYGMSMIARYAESTHFKPLIISNQSLQQFAD
jgi:hypothetical protein